MTNVFSSFWSWFETCLAWFFPPTLLAEPFVALIIKGLEFFFGCWLLYILILKPILMVFNLLSNKIYGGR